MYLRKIRLFANKTPETLADSNKILQAYTQTQIPRVKILAPSAAKRWVFCNGYNKVAVLYNGTDRHEIREKNVNRCALLNLNRRILKTFD